MSVISMTGMGESRVDFKEGGGVRVFCKSVNQRFLDVSVKAPPILAPLESQLAGLVKDQVSRGRVELQITLDVPATHTGGISLHGNVIESVLAQVKTAAIPGLTQSDIIASVLPVLWSRKEVLEFNSTQEGLDGAIVLDVLKAAKAAVEMLVEARKKEGIHLEAELTHQLSQVEAKLHDIDAISAQFAEREKVRLQGKLAELLGDTQLDESRLLQEVAILADKADIQEERVRLRAHVDHFKSIMGEGGRKMEFLLQEMHREINTIGSKSSDIEMSRIVVDVKSYFEKMREQIQNVE